MIRALGLPHFGQTSRWGAGTLGVLRFWRRSVWMESGCIGVLPIISNQGVACGSFCGLFWARSQQARPFKASFIQAQPSVLRRGFTLSGSVVRSAHCKRLRSEEHHGNSRRSAHCLVNRRAFRDCGDCAATCKSLTNNGLEAFSGFGEGARPGARHRVVGFRASRRPQHSPPVLR